jgi:Tfp pilus assembly protein PilN
VVLPVPGWLFFLETLPLGDTTAASEDTVQLSLESHAPLPVEQLAYGWALDTSRKTLLYYATARERLRQHTNGVYEKAGFLLPDFLLAPDKEAGLWHWLVTPDTLTAVRFAAGATLPAEIRSWPLPAGEPYTLAARATTERTARESQCAGPQSKTTLLWNGATYGTGVKTIVATWLPVGGGHPRTITLPVVTAWDADVRERPWLAKTRKTRAGIRLTNKLLLAAAAVWLLVALLAAAVFFYKKSVQAEADRIAARQIEVDTITSNSELITKLDEMEAGKVAFYDALATLNHYRPMEVFFSNANVNSHRQIQVNGTAPSITQLNTYVEALRKNGSFTEVETQRVNTAAGRTTFDLRVTVGTLSVAHGALAEKEINEMAKVFFGSDLPPAPPVDVPPSAVMTLPAPAPIFPTAPTLPTAPMPAPAPESPPPPTAPTLPVETPPPSPIL